MLIEIGTVLSCYEINALLGKGGMGEVYRARDSRLKREVAIKVLPEEFSREADRLGRFQREAEALASLNHPNIGAIYDLQEHRGCRFLVLELVEGSTLAERMAAGRLPVDEALQIVIQICEALEAAHDKGILHRDLKPANVKIQPAGQVKVLDFGLAKAMDQSPAASSLSQSPTMSLAATAAGIILGTAAYMSPEQARGQETDQRTDVFSLGCILYEMLTGRLAFQGDTISDVLASVLKSEPDFSLLPPSLDPRLRTILKRCLEKNRKKRWHAVGDLRIEIESLLSAPQEIAPMPVVAVAPGPGTSLWKKVVLAAAMLVIGAGAAGTMMWALRPKLPEPIVTRFNFPLGEGQVLATTRLTLAISPDGTKLVYGARRLYLRRMGEFEAKPIPGAETTGGLGNPVFSPDGESLAYFSTDDKTIKRIAVSGGAAATICPINDPLLGMSWSEDGIVFADSTHNVMRVSPSGGQPETLVSAKENEAATMPQMLPGGKEVLFSLSSSAGLGDQAQLVVQDLATGTRKVVLQGGTDGRYVQTGHIVYGFSGTLRAVPFDIRRLEARGAPVTVLEGIARGSGPSVLDVVQFSFGDNGTLVYVPGPVSTNPADSILGVVDTNGVVESLKVPAGAHSLPRVSPDGKQVIFQTDVGSDVALTIYDLDGKSAGRRLTFKGKNRFPVWSPDSKFIAFQSDSEGGAGIFRQAADGSAQPQRLTKAEPGTEHIPNCWSPDGQTLLFTVKKDNNSFTVFSQSLKSGDTELYGNIQSATSIDPVFSPDGHWVAYTSRETGTEEVFIQPFPATGAKYQIPKTANNHGPVWTPDGKGLLYLIGPQRMGAVTVGFQPAFNVGPVSEVFRGVNNAPFFARNYDVMKDGKHIIRPVAPANLSNSETITPQISVVLNWFEELKRRAPVK